MFKTETHLHTNPTSACAWLSAAEMIRRYHEAGYTTVFVTDHLSPSTLDRLGRNEKGWAYSIDAFLQGFRDAHAEGVRLGLNVLMGAELSLPKNHFLLYGIDRDFLCASEGILDMTPAELCAHAHAHGVAVIQAHPLRDGKCTPFPDCVDGMEAVNSNPRHENYEAEIFAIIQKHGLAVTAGSDAHRIEDVAGAAMLSDVPITSGKQFASLLLEGKLRLMKGAEML